MDGHFNELLKRVKLTKVQRDDAKKKYRGVAKKLHSSYYPGEYDGSTKLLIGSYGKKTNIRPPGDIDLLFKIPLETYSKFYDYESNGPAALLQEIRNILNTKYTTTEKVKAWGKVVLVKTAEGAHDIELLPAIEIDGIYIIPNSENEGSWETFDVKSEIDSIAKSNHETSGLTRKLVRIMKCWKQQNTGMNLKSFELEEFCVRFLAEVDNLELLSMGELVVEFLEFLIVNYSEDTTYLNSAYARGQKALLFEVTEQFKESCNEWRKIFGAQNFPVYSTLLERIYKLEKQYPSTNEEYIEDLHRIKIDTSLKLNISTQIQPNSNGFRSIKWHLRDFLSRFPGIPADSTIFFKASMDVEDISFKWKVRNFGEQAKRENHLRGEIKDGSSDGLWQEPTKYHGFHYIECYAIKDGDCIAITRQKVPINTNVVSDNE